MRPRLRIQARPRSEDAAPERERLPPPKPIPPAFKLLAVMGIVVFWLYFFGVLGEGGHGGTADGFLLFVLAQLPLLWHWMRNLTRPFR